MLSPRLSWQVMATPDQLSAALPRKLWHPHARHDARELRLDLRAMSRTIGKYLHPLSSHHSQICCSPGLTNILTSSVTSSTKANRANQVNDDGDDGAEKVDSDGDFV